MAYYTNSKIDDVNVISAGDLNSIQAGFALAEADILALSASPVTVTGTTTAVMTADSATGSDSTIRVSENSVGRGVMFWDASASALYLSNSVLNVGLKITGGLANIIGTNVQINGNDITGLSASGTELNLLDGVPGTLTTAEIGYLDGVTSSIQTQLNTKAPLDSPALTTAATLDGVALATINTPTLASLTTVGALGSGSIASGFGAIDNGASNITTTGTIAGGVITQAGVNVATLNTNWLTADITDITSTAAELNILDGVTSTTAELNILDGVTSTAAELNILDGVTSTAAELNILDGVTSTAAEINVLAGIPGTLTATEIGYVDGVTSAIQAQLNAKAPLDSPAFTTTATLDGILLSTAINAYGLKLANETRSSTTVADDTQIVATIPALGVYKIDMILRVSSATSSGIKVNFSGGNVPEHGAFTVWQDTIAAAESKFYLGFDLSMSLNNLANCYLHFVGMVNAGGATDCTLQWASTDGTNVTVLARSVIQLTKVG